VPKRPSITQREPAEAERRELAAERHEPAAELVGVESCEPSTGSRAIFPWLLLLLAGSGCAALIYEIVWFQLLQLVIGSSAISLGLLLAAYMGGLCLGSVLLPKYVSSREHPLKVYAYLELGIGVFGLLALYGVPVVGRLYLAGAGEGVFGLVLRGLVAAVCLLPPTLLMGGSLPAISRWAGSSPKGVSWMGFLYSANIAGAVFGCLFAGFYLLRVHDLAVATYAAVGINVAVGLLGFVLVSRTPHSAEVGVERASRPVGGREHGAAGRTVTDLEVRSTALVYLAIAISGLTALGAEVVWTRLLSLLLGATTYTFSIILAVYLAGLWTGSTAGSFAARRMKSPRWGLALCQIGLAATIGWTGYTLSHSLPYWPVDPWLSLDPTFNFELDIARCVWAIFPATLLWGASFPLALAAARSGHEDDPARISGEVYAANTAGSILGALAFSLFLIPAIGTQGSQQLLIVLSAAGALVAAASFVRTMPRVEPMRAAAVAVGIIAVAWGFTLAVQDVPWQVIAYGRRVAPIMRAFNLYDQDHPTTVLYRGEGINSSLLIAERAGQRHFYVSGKAEASTAILDMRLERMMGHIPGLIHPHPRDVLTVGFGAGITAGSFVNYPDVDRLVICELEKQIPPASSEYFNKENYDVLHNPRTHIVYDDARHYIFTTRDQFDVITTDPIHPWVKGTSTLYSKEYYELCKRHLKAGGVVAQWLPIYDSDPETVKIELATFFDVFPNGTIWSNFLRTRENPSGEGYDLVLLGWADSAPLINVDEMQQRLDTPGYAPVAASIRDVGFNSAVEFLATYAGRASDLTPLTAGATVNQDLNMRLQYIAGLGLNYAMEQKIYRDVLRYRKFPDGLLAGTGGRIDALRTLLAPVFQTPGR
jgi:spermidine synthase